MGKVTKLLVGCPVANRNWILDRWRDHVEQATPGNWDLEYLFVVGKEDKTTIDFLDEWSRTTLVLVDEPEPPANRSWSGLRFHHMVFLRNSLLERVQEIKPTLFLSLDSDILIGQDSIRNMYDTMQNYQFNAVGGLTWLDPIDDSCTNAAKWSNAVTKHYTRVQSPGTYEVDIIMAVKLMDNFAYSINYVFDKRGEDFGWSKELKKAAGRIGFDGRAPSKHVMSPEYLERIDKRVGW